MSGYVPIEVLAAEVNAELALMNAPTTNVGLKMISLKYAIPITAVYFLYRLYRKKYGKKLAFTSHGRKNQKVWRR